jgi:hypothetical protein
VTVQAANQQFEPTDAAMLVLRASISLPAASATQPCISRVVVAGELPCKPHNAPLQLFSAAPELVDFASGAYLHRSQQTSRLLGQLFERLRGEGFAMSFTMEDFNRQYIKEHFPQLTPEEQREALERLPPEKQQEILKALPPEKRLAGLSAEQILEYLERLTTGRPTTARKSRRKK